MDVVIFTILFLFSLLAGILMHRSDFCIAGMFRDIFLFRNTTKILPLILLIILSMGLFHGGHALGLIHDLPAPWYGKPTLAMIPGGFIFGIGMVLAGGCVVGTLFRMGAGQVLSWVAFLGILLGSLVFLVSVPWWKSVAPSMSLHLPKSIPQWLNINPNITGFVIFIAGSLLVYRWHRTGKFRHTSPVRGYISPALTAIILAGISTLFYILLNAPIGVTTSYTKLATGLINIMNHSWYQSLPLVNTTVVSFNNPFTGTMIQGTMGYSWDGIYLAQLPAIAGITAGSFASALHLGEFRLHVKMPARQYVSALTGGVLLGYSSRIALGCNVWHLMGGLPFLAWGGFLFLVGLIPGAAAGAFIFKRYVIG